MPKRKPLSEQVYEALILLVTVGFLAWVLGHMIGCTTAPANNAPPANPNYELTLSGTLDGAAFTGIAMGSKASQHTITIQSRNDVNYFIAQTCHRFDKREDVISQGWIRETQSWSYTFNQSPTLEDTGDCPMRICVYSKTVGAPPVQCAVIDFMNDKYQLQAQNICNGQAPINHGKSLCHTKSGLVERMIFKSPVVIPDPEPMPQGGDPNKTYLIPNQCDGKFIDKNNTVWQYVMPENECYIIFADMKAPHPRAKLTVIPYDKPLYSGGN